MVSSDDNPYRSPRESETETSGSDRRKASGWYRGMRWFLTWASIVLFGMPVLLMLMVELFRWLASE